MALTVGGLNLSAVGTPGIFWLEAIDPLPIIQLRVEE